MPVRFLFPIPFGLAATMAGADVLLDQPPDFQEMHWSFDRTPTGGAGLQVGDDFRVDEPVIVESITFWLAASWPNVPMNWSFNVHWTTRHHRNDGWAYAPDWPFFYRMRGPSQVIDLGLWEDDEYGTLHLFEVRFENLGLRLDPGPVQHDLDGPLVGRIYWFSPEGHVPDYPRQFCFWTTSGNGKVAGDEGWIRLEPWESPGWAPLSRLGIDPSDYAMRIVGRPARADEESTAALADVEVVTGRLLDGGVREIRHADDIHLVAISQPFSDYYHRTGILVRARTDVEDPDHIDLSLETESWRAGGDFEEGINSYQTVAMRNWQSGRFWPIGEGTWINDLPVTHIFRDLDPALFVNDNGEMEILIEHQVRGSSERFSRNEGAYLVYLDRVRVEVTPQED